MTLTIPRNCVFPAADNRRAACGRNIPDGLNGEGRDNPQKIIGFHPLDKCRHEARLRLSRGDAPR